MFRLEASVVEVVEVGFDVLSVAVYVSKEELGDGGLAVAQLLGEPKDRRGAAFILLLDVEPPLAGAAGGLGPLEVMLFDALDLGADLLIGPSGGIRDAFRRRSLERSRWRRWQGVEAVLSQL